MEKFLEGYSFGATNPVGPTAPLSTVSSQNSIFLLIIIAAVIVAIVGGIFAFMMKKSESNARMNAENAKALATLKSAQLQAMATIKAAELRGTALSKDKAAYSKLVATDSVKDFDKCIDDILSIKDLGYGNSEMEEMLNEITALQAEKKGD